MSPDEELLDAAENAVVDPTKRGDKHLVLDDVFDGIDDDNNMKQPSSITLPIRRPSSPSNQSTVSDLSESVATTTTTRSQPHNSAFIVTPRGEFESEEHRSSMVSSSHSVPDSLARKIFEEAPEDELFLESTNQDWFHMADIAKAFSFGSSSGNVKNRESSTTTTTTATTTAAIVTPEKTERGGGDNSSPVDEDDGFMGALATFLHDIARECSAVGKSLADVCQINDTDVEQLMHIVTQEVTRTPPTTMVLDQEDAAVPPTPSPQGDDGCHPIDPQS